jgi:hypothetical protein
MPPGEMQIKRSSFSWELIFDKRFVLSLWFGLCLLGIYKVFSEYGFNNYLIFRGVFYHTIHQQDLYMPYPAEYGDVNLYGPVFSLVIAPFACLPVKAGIILWLLFNASFLAFAVYKMPLPARWQAALLLLCGHELLISATFLQINPFICACILLGFSYTYKQKEFLALFFILLAAFIKVYGIVGFSFFFLSQRKIRFAAWAIGWSVILFIAPVIISSFSFLLQSYRHWFFALKTKFAINDLMGKRAIYQNVSVPGMIRRIFYLPQMDDAAILVPAIWLQLSLFRLYLYFNDKRYGLYILCSILLALVIFSNSSESNTYIIAMPGMCLWYLMQPKTKLVNVYFITAFVFTTFAYTDLLTAWSRHHLYRPYSLKALFPFITWLIIIYQVNRKQFLKAILPSDKKEVPDHIKKFLILHAV